VEVRIAEEREPKEIMEARARVKCLPVANQAWPEYLRN